MVIFNLLTVQQTEFDMNIQYKFTYVLQNLNILPKFSIAAPTKSQRLLFWYFEQKDKHIIYDFFISKKDFK